MCTKVGGDCGFRQKGQFSPIAWQGNIKLTFTKEFCQIQFFPTLCIFSASPKRGPYKNGYFFHDAANK